MHPNSCLRNLRLIKTMSNKWFFLNTPPPHPTPPHPTHPTHPTPPNPTPAFSEIYPITGRSHGLAAAPGHGQVALGTKKVALVRPPQVRVRSRSRYNATFLVPSATWPWPGAAAASNWERPVTGNAITLDFRKRRGGVGWGVNFGLVGSSFRVSYPTVLDPIKIFVFSNPSRGVCVCGLCQFSPNLCTIIAPWWENRIRNLLPNLGFHEWPLGFVTRLKNYLLF